MINNMGTWGIAKDMAKINEMNLSKLSGGRLHAKLKDYQIKKISRNYTFKKASKEVLENVKINSRKNLKVNTIKSIIALVVSILVGCVIMFGVVHLIHAVTNF